MCVRLSVVIACYNAADTLPGTLEALAAQQWSEPWEIVVVNNRSTDNSMAVVEHQRAYLPNLRTVDALDRQGRPYAYNVGVASARGESVAFVDADDEVGSGWLAAMGNALAQHPFVAARMETESLNDSWICRARGRPQHDGLQRYKYPPYLPHAGGGTLGFRRELFVSMGGFNETDLRNLADCDFCWRVQRSGVPLVFVPEAVIHVRFRTTMRGLFRQAKTYGIANVVLYKLHRQYGMPTLTWKHGARAWIKLVIQLPRVRSKEQFARWVWNLGWRLGRLESCVKHKVMAL